MSVGYTPHALNSYINCLFSTDLVFTFGETTGWYALQCMRAKMLLDEVGQEILEYVNYYIIQPPEFYHIL